MVRSTSNRTSNIQISCHFVRDTALDTEAVEQRTEKAGLFQVCLSDPCLPRLHSQNAKDVCARGVFNYHTHTRTHSRSRRSDMDRQARMLGGPDSRALTHTRHAINTGLLAEDSYKHSFRFCRSAFEVGSITPGTKVIISARRFQPSGWRKRAVSQSKVDFSTSAKSPHCRRRAVAPPLPIAPARSS